MKVTQKTVIVRKLKVLPISCFGQLACLTVLHGKCHVSWFVLLRKSIFSLVHLREDALPAKRVLVVSHYCRVSGA